MSDKAFRIEHDSMGELEVPADALWGAQTQRSLMNFPIGWEKQPVAIVRALGVVKQACAEANKKAGALDAKLADATRGLAKVYRDRYGISPRADRGARRLIQAG